MSETVTITGDHPSFQSFQTIPQQGSGPGLIFISENYNITKEIEQEAIQLSEEGYVVHVPDLSNISPDDDKMILCMKSVITYLNKIPKKVGKIGIIGRGYGGYIILKLFESLSNLFDCMIIYYPKNIENKMIDNLNIKIPFMIHLIDDNDKSLKNDNKFIEVYKYPNANYGFASITENFDKSSSGMAYSRTLTILKKTIGPIYDLNALWDKHIEYEFETKDVHKTMETMVSEPYVNHIPTMTGGVGYDHLFRFYKYYFVNSNPPDTRIIPISRTVGTDCIVDEMIFSFTHTQQIDWILPGISPTNKFVEIPLVAIVKFRGNKLYNEHIYWDQASVLVQIGLLSKEGLPITGGEQVKKLLDNSIPSNRLINSWSETLKKEI
ncbi:hypothetical protein RclHR1_03750020 [Rhizophagus clarus]|uniref:Dienelactone hydrolase family protein n=1 Tax=Rhizophagus clarus TaxID=94130 RepID=A0A2Z6RDW7_9GLOM|nr:hypothetical protein RclHR1_03750020 [Rhizophagus clarus]GET02459.1 dienelactone hydrolase family protein [Rhizophagus clarus]